MKVNSVLLKSTVVAALGGLLFGFDTAVISGTTGAVDSKSTDLSSKSLGSHGFYRNLGYGLRRMLAGFTGNVSGGVTACE